MAGPSGSDAGYSRFPVICAYGLYVPNWSSRPSKFYGLYVPKSKAKKPPRIPSYMFLIFGIFGLMGNGMGQKEARGEERDGERKEMQRG